MKVIFKIVTVIVLTCSLGLSASAQQLMASTENTVPLPDKPTAPAADQERAVTIKNSCERGVVIFAGAKEGIRDPRLNTYGGLSINKVYVTPGHVVCMMTVDK